jgi:hypothetical protein
VDILFRNYFFEAEMRNKDGLGHLISRSIRLSFLAGHMSSDRDHS